MTVRKKEIRQLLRIRLVMASASWLRTQNSIQFLSSFSRPMTHKSFMFSMANLGMYHTGGRHVELRHVIGRGTCCLPHWRSRDLQQCPAGTTDQPLQVSGGGGWYSYPPPGVGPLLDTLQPPKTSLHQRSPTSTM